MKAKYCSAPDDLLHHNPTLNSQIWVISRHTATTEWLKQEYGIQACHISHLDEQQITRLKKGDTVIGNLPEHLAARLCRKGIRYCVVSLNYEKHPNLRGQNLSLSDMKMLDAHLQRYRVIQVLSESFLTDEEEEK